MVSFMPGSITKLPTGKNWPRLYVGGVPALRSWETAVTSCAGANGLANMMLLGTPLEPQSSTLRRSYKQRESAKLMKLCDAEGFKCLDDLLALSITDSMCPAICMTEGCD